MAKPRNGKLAHIANPASLMLAVAIGCAILATRMALAGSDGRAAPPSSENPVDLDTASDKVLELPRVYQGAIAPEGNQPAADSSNNAAQQDRGADNNSDADVQSAATNPGDQNTSDASGSEGQPSTGAPADGSSVNNAANGNSLSGNAVASNGSSESDADAASRVPVGNMNEYQQQQADAGPAVVYVPVPVGVGPIYPRPLYRPPVYRPVYRAPAFGPGIANPMPVVPGYHGFGGMTSVMPAGPMTSTMPAPMIMRGGFGGRGMFRR
ncbi:MAG: hypothetical protein ACREQE_02665 [Candidatus Binataceae bacterium]